jgi:superfamily I DNA and/or RNA helicase
MPRVREIEETLRQAQIDPRLIGIICTLAERQRYQHQQISGIAQLFNRIIDLISQLMLKMNIRDANLKKLGVEEMMKSKGVSVESVESFDESGINTTGDDTK